MAGQESVLLVGSAESGQEAVSAAGERDDKLVLTMQNVIPEEHATKEAAAGPYVVMVAELLRAG